VFIAIIIQLQRLQIFIYRRLWFLVNIVLKYFEIEMLNLYLLVFSKCSNMLTLLTAVTTI